MPNYLNYLDQNEESIQRRLDALDELKISRAVDNLVEQGGLGGLFGYRKVGGKDDPTSGLLNQIGNVWNSVFNYDNYLSDNKKRELVFNQMAGSKDFAGLTKGLKATERSALLGRIRSDKDFLKDPEGTAGRIVGEFQNSLKANLGSRLDRLRERKEGLASEAASPVNRENIAASQANRQLAQKRFGLEQQSLGLKRQELGMQLAESRARIADFRMGRRLQAAELALGAGNAGLSALANSITRL